MNPPKPYSTVFYNSPKHPSPQVDILTEELACAESVLHTITHLLNKREREIGKLQAENIRLQHEISDSHKTPEIFPDAVKFVKTLDSLRTLVQHWELHAQEISDQLEDSRFRNLRLTRDLEISSDERRMIGNFLVEVVKRVKIEKINFRLSPNRVSLVEEFKAWQARLRTVQSEM